MNATTHAASSRAVRTPSCGGSASGRIAAQSVPATPIANPAAQAAAASVIAHMPQAAIAARRWLMAQILSDRRPESVTASPAPRGPRARPASSPARIVAMSRSRRDGEAESGRRPDREDRRLQRRVGVVARQQLLVRPLALDPRAERRLERRSDAPQCAARQRPAEAARGRHQLARPARAQDHDVRRAVGHRGAERDRRRQPRVDVAPAVELDRRAREQRQRRRRPQAEPQRGRVADLAVEVDRVGGGDLGGDRVQLGRAGEHGVEQPRRELLVALLHQPPHVDHRPAPRERLCRREISSPTSDASVQVGMPSRTRPLTSHIALSVPADEP